MRWTHVLMAYFLIGAIMWGGGVLAYEDTGISTYLMDDPTSINENASDDLENSGGPIQEVATSLGGSGLLAAWNIVVKFIGYVFWPITALQAVNAPPRITVTLGGTFVVAFFGAIIMLFRGV